MSPTAELHTDRAYNSKPTSDRGPEEGQVIVEFALVLFPLLLLVVGVIQFGIAINFWLDQQRLAAQGTRVAVVNCAAASWCTPTLAEYLEAQTLSRGNRPNATVCFETKSGGTRALVGDPVTVKLDTLFPLVPILNFGSVMLSARTTMRLEQDATNPGIAAEPECT